MEIKVNQKAENYFNLLIEKKRDFELSTSEHGTEIKCNGIKEYFTDKKTEYDLFGCFNSLKSELKSKVEKCSKFDYPKIYYDSNGEFINFNLNDSIDFKTTYQIDLSSAYLTSLKNSKMISNKLFEKINRMTKKNRLKCLGLLAYQKTVYKFKSGEFNGIEKKKENEFSKCFEFCVKKIAKIMSEIKKIIGEGFLFFWTDCIYFRGFENIEIIENYFRDRNYAFKTKRMFNFKFEMKRSYFKITYRKFKDEILTECCLNVPYLDDFLNVLKINLKTALFRKDFEKIQFYKSEIQKFYEFNLV